MLLLLARTAMTSPWGDQAPPQQTTLTPGGRLIWSCRKFWPTGLPFTTVTSMTQTPLTPPTTPLKTTLFASGDHEGCGTVRDVVLLVGTTTVCRAPFAFIT